MKILAIFKSHIGRIAFCFPNNFEQDTNCQSSHHTMKILALTYLF